MVQAWFQTRGEQHNMFWGHDRFGFVLILPLRYASGGFLVSVEFYLYESIINIFDPRSNYTLS